jgi:hypothetical protein
LQFLSTITGGGASYTTAFVLVSFLLMDAIGKRIKFAIAII